MVEWVFEKDRDKEMIVVQLVWLILGRRRSGSDYSKNVRRMTILSRTVTVAHFCNYALVGIPLRVLPHEAEVPRVSMITYMY